MKLRNIVPVALLVSGAFGIAMASQGCSSSSTASTGTSSGGTEPPAMPTGPATTSTTARTFALYSLFLGGTDRNGTVDQNAWKGYGYDLDHETTTATSTNVCTQAAGAQKSEQADGTNGIDNSFGENILPIITSVDPTAEATINTSIQAGSFTVMFNITGLTDDASQTATGLTGQIFAGAEYNEATTDGGTPSTTPPAFTTSTNWPVSPALLSSQSPITSPIQLTGAYVNAGVFVATATQITLSLSIGGESISIAINDAIITFDHVGSDPNELTTGTIAGIINTAQLTSSLKSVAGRLSTSLCQGAAFTQIADEIAQASDIIDNPTAPNAAGVPCDAISIGIGFSAKEIANPTIVAPTPVATPDPCATAGTDGGT